jgi:hypothetical protein
MDANKGKLETQPKSLENASPIMDANKGKLETQPKSLVDRRTVEVEPGK